MFETLIFFKNKAKKKPNQPKMIFALDIYTLEYHSKSSRTEIKFKFVNLYSILLRFYLNSQICPYITNKAKAKKRNDSKMCD